MRSGEPSRMMRRNPDKPDVFRDVDKVQRPALRVGERKLTKGVRTRDMVRDHERAKNVDPYDNHLIYRPDIATDDFA